jgi:hypothetical protein
MEGSEWCARHARRGGGSKAVNSGLVRRECVTAEDAGVRGGESRLLIGHQEVLPADIRLAADFFLNP